MPAPVSSSVSPNSAGKHGTAKPNAPASLNKTRIVRRRGRAKAIPESDDEIEREAGTDLDSDDDQSSLDSGSESSPESVHERDLVNGHSQPSSSTGPQLNKETHPSPKAVLNGDIKPSFFEIPGNWSEMVADENTNGPADLPIIDFEEFDRNGMEQPPQVSSHSLQTPKKSSYSKSSPKNSQVPTSPTPTSSNGGQEEQERNEHSVASSSRQLPNGMHSPKRPIGQTARQVYQQRLESDPSYVPTVGEFWSHDERLLDKDLRSLSGWWRGRWQGRGRGRGGFDRGFAMRARGRGGHFGHPIPTAFDQPHPEGQQPAGQTPQTPPQVAPIEQPWTHDGFEEMKRKDEQRHSQEQPASFQASRGLAGVRGKGGVGRGRGTFYRKGFDTSPPKPRPGLSPRSTDRHWFAMKPERMWTKQHDAFLYFDFSLKPRHGQGPAYRIKLPGYQPQVVKGQTAQSTASVSLSQLSVAAPSTAGASSSEDGEKPIIVRLPPRTGHNQPSANTVPEVEPISTVDEPPIDDVFVVKPERILSAPAVIPQADPTSSTANNSIKDGNSIQTDPSSLPIPSTQTVSKDQQLPQHDLQDVPNAESTGSSQWIQNEVDIMKHSVPEAASQPDGPAQPRPSHPVLPPLQTAFAPVPRGSPSFGSPYAYGPALPPGIAMNQHGMPYELATGRAVYLQPPTTMYNPRPVMHSHVTPPGISFVPGHVHHHSNVSPAPEFLAQPPSHTPPINGFVDPSSGMPIFSLPRSSRVEIRAPTEQADSKTSSKLFAHRPSGLRSNAAVFESANGTEDTGPNYVAEGAYSTSDVNHCEDVQAAANPPAVDAGVMYPFYPQQYYYPETYGYPQYMEVASYEMYSPDPRAGQSTVYY